MITRHTLVLLLACGLLAGQGLAQWHGIVHAGRFADTHAGHVHGTDAHGFHAHGPDARGGVARVAAIVDRESGAPDRSSADCSIPDGAVPAPAPPTCHSAVPNAPAGAPDAAAIVAGEATSAVIGGGQARAPPTAV